VLWEHEVAGSNPAAPTILGSSVVEAVAEGLTDREIAKAPVLSRRTVEGHVARLIHKLGARNRTEAAARYRSLT
jgi:two-component system nitrate/nitrite response regulator NarL